MGAMDGTQIYDNFNAGKPEVLQAWGDSIAELSSGYADEAAAIADLQTQMNQSWTGASGDAASAGAGPLAVAFRDSSVPLDETTKLMSMQTDSLESAKSSVVPVPPAPEKPSGWSLALKSAIPLAGPVMAVNDLNNYQDGVQAHNAANETNVRVMDQYSSATSSNQGSIPLDYQPLALDGHSISVSSPKLSVAGGVLGAEYSDATHASSSTVAPSVGSIPGGGPVSAGPTLNGPSSTSITGPGGGGPSAPVSAGPTLNGATPTAPPGGGNTFVPGAGPGYTDPSGKNTTGKNTSTTSRNTNSGRNSAANRLFTDAEPEGLNNNRRASQTGSGRGSSSGGPGSAEEERLGRGGSAGERVLRGGAGAGESASRGLSAGKASGGGAFGNAAAAEEAAAGRAGGTRSANGAPVGAAGGRGRDEEDEEHQRPDYLIEPDPDAVFGIDVRTAPPVIGE